jgi:hypothetical protein
MQFPSVASSSATLTLSSFMPRSMRPSGLGQLRTVVSIQRRGIDTRAAERALLLRKRAALAR